MTHYVRDFETKKPYMVSRNEYYMLRGMAYYAANRFDSISKNQSREWIFINPSDSDNRIVFDLIVVNAQNLLDVDIFLNSNQDVSGTPLPPVNKRINGNSSVVDINIGGDYSGGTLIFSHTIPEAVGEVVLGGQGGFGNRQIDPGKNLRFLITNRANGPNIRSSFRLEWIEVPVDYQHDTA